jgi:hypothetical protein
MMPFPFTEVEWAAVREAVLQVDNSGLADDEVLRASHLASLLDVLAMLRTRYGDHPVLVETEADFTEDDYERVALYHRAAATALDNGLPTLSIRLSLAEVLLELGRPVEAAAELLACEPDLVNCDESERASWSELSTEARRATPGPAPTRGCR